MLSRTSHKDLAIIAIAPKDRLFRSRVVTPRRHLGDGVISLLPTRFFVTTMHDQEQITKFTHYTRSPIEHLSLLIFADCNIHQRRMQNRDHPMHDVSLIEKHSLLSRNTSRVRYVATHSKSSSRGISHSTARTALARSATVSALGTRWTDR